MEDDFEELTNDVSIPDMGEAEQAAIKLMGQERYDELIRFNDEVAEAQLAQTKAIVTLTNAKAALYKSAPFITSAFAAGLIWVILSI